jgi:iron-sulfur cluster repair protein YtfE (RIC family)
MTNDQVDQATIGRPQGQRPDALAAQLRWVHDMLRRDLLTIQQLAVRVSAGALANEVERELHSLQTNGPVFQLRVHCLSYCQTLESHHRNEDSILFPAVLRAAPQLAATVDRLQADHLIVASLLSEIDNFARDLADSSTRQALVNALEDLSSNLLRHLDLEEAALQPVLESWSSWPEDASAGIRDEAVRRAR